MKSIIVTLVTLALVMGSAKAGPMTQGEPPKSFKQQVQNIMVSAADYFLNENDNETRPPVKAILELIVGALPCIDLKPWLLADYTMICGEENCERDAPKCMDALMPTGMCAFHKECFPKAVEAALFMGKSLKMEMEDCVMEKIMISRGLAYQVGEYEENLNYILGSIMVEDQVKNDLMDAAAGKCMLPPRDVSCITDKIRFNICLMNTCVNSKRLLPNAV